MQAYLQFGSGAGPFQTIAVDSRETVAPYARTVTGYGYRLPTPFMVKWEGRWRRVYVCCYSNSGTAYIGKNLGECVAKVDFDYSSMEAR